MKNNSNSFDSSSQSNKSSSGYGSKKRNLKRIRKDQDGSRFENSDSLKEKEAYKKYEGMEEMKTSIRSEQRIGSAKTSYPEISSFDNHFQREKEPSSSQRKKFRRMINSEEEEDHRSNSSSKVKYNRVKVKKIDDEEIYHDIVSLLQTDERVRSIIKSERSNYRKLKYEYNKKRHFMGTSLINNDQYKEEEQAGYHEIVDSMLEKFESLQLQGFETLKKMHIKYLEDKIKKGDKHVDYETIERIKLMNVDEWEKSLTDKEKRKIK